jgi:hypothetical protein
MIKIKQLGEEGVSLQDAACRENDKRRAEQKLEAKGCR